MTDSDRIAALYDIHGNLPALEAVLSELSRREIRRIVIGGDLVLGPMPRETLAAARAWRGTISFVRGNCDRLVAAAAAGTLPDKVPPAFADAMRWCASQLASDDIALLRELPDSVALSVAGVGPVYFCHATARNDEEIFTVRTPDDRVAEMFKGITAPVVVCGHTHMQFDRRVGDLRIINAGSVGMPFGEPGADWCEIASDLRMHHTPYDLAAAASLVRQTSYPAAEQFASREILAPQSAEAMLKAFGS